MNIFIDLTGKIGDKHLMDEELSGSSLLERLLVLARMLEARRVTLNMPEDKKAEAKPIIERYFEESDYCFSGPGSERADIELDVKNVYDSKIAVKEYKNAGDLKRAVVWTIESGNDLAAAEAELARTQWFPISRYYIVPMARRLAGFLSGTRVTPNQVTAASVVVALAAAALLLPGKAYLYPLAGVLYLVFWLLDITDGKLARMKGMVSDFGKWFDPVAGEAADYILHLAIVYNLYTRTYNAWILWAGIFYFIGKHMALYFMQAGNEAFGARSEDGAVVSGGGQGSLLAKAAHFIHDADIRKHFIAICICFNVMIVPLVFYAVYYNAWALSKFILEYARYKRREA